METGKSRQKRNAVGERDGIQLSKYLNENKKLF